MKKYFVIALFALTVSLQSCHLGSIGTWKNSSINANVKTEIATLNDQLFKRIMARDVNGVREMMSQRLLELKGSQVDSIITSVGSTYKAKEYRLLDEYYTQNFVSGVDVTLRSGRGDANDYVLKYKAIEKDVYASLMVSKNRPVDCLVLAVYGKQADGWKLNILQIGKYAILSKTAPDLYAEALKQYKKESWINATSNMIVAAELAAPATTYFEYAKDEEMKIFYNKVIKEANSFYGFPITVSKVPTAPKIVSISPRFIDTATMKGVYPVINYVTKISQQSTFAVAAENDLLQKHIGTLFKGITQDNPCIVYHVFDQPDTNFEPKLRHVFIQKLN